MRKNHVPLESRATATQVSGKLEDKEEGEELLEVDMRR